MSHQSDVIHAKHATVHQIDITQPAYDQRLKPKARKHRALWQLYLIHHELTELRKKHVLRLSSANRNKSNLIPELEQSFIDMFDLDQHVNPKNKAQREGIGYDSASIFSQMVLRGQEVGPIWDWLLNHKGIGESLAAKTLALINDIEKFDTIAKLWRYSGYGLNNYWCDTNGKAVCPAEGWKWVEIKKGKSYRIWTVVSDHSLHVTHEIDVNNNDRHTLVTHHPHVNSNNSHPINVTQTTHAIPIEKQWAIPQNNTLPPLERVDFLETNPEWELKNLSDRLCKHYHAPYNTPLKSTLYLIAEQFNKANTSPYKDLYVVEKERLMNERGIKRGHASNMAFRKMKKEFLKQLWLAWRQFEGLPISEEYQKAMKTMYSI